MILNTLTQLISGCVGVSDNGNGSYTVTLSDHSTRAVTAAEIATAAAQAISDKANAPATRAQLRRALLQLGQLTAIDALMAGNAEWEHGEQFQPRDAVITAIRKKLSKPYSFMDQAFRLARTL